MLIEYSHFHSSSRASRTITTTTTTPTMSFGEPFGDTQKVEKTQRRRRDEESFSSPASKRSRYGDSEMQPAFVSIVSTANLQTFIPQSVTTVEDRNLLVAVLAEMVKLNDYHREPPPTFSPEQTTRIHPHPKICIRDRVEEKAHYYVIHMIFPCLMILNAEQFQTIHQHAPLRIPLKTIQQYIGLGDLPPTWHIVVNVHSLAHAPPPHALGTPIRAMVMLSQGGHIELPSFASASSAVSPPAPLPPPTSRFAGFIPGTFF